MSVRTLTDRETDETVLYDSCTMTAFGPVFESEAHAEAFLTWLTTTYGWDGRGLSLWTRRELNDLYGLWLDAEGHVPLDALSDTARRNDLYARAVVGREFAVPAVTPRGLH